MMYALTQKDWQIKNIKKQKYIILGLPNIPKRVGLFRIRTD